MMKRITLALSAFLLITASNISAQVTNYALSLPAGASAFFGQTPQMDNLSTGTIQFWLYASAWTEGAAVCQRGENESRFAIELGGTNQLVMRSGASQLAFTNSKFVANSWVQVTLTFGDGSVDLSVNGAKAETKAATFFVPASTADFVLGGEGFIGRLDEFRLWNVVLTDPFFQMWRNTVTKWHPQWDNLLVYYKFDQDQCSNIVDYKFNYHGAFQSGATRLAVTDNALFKYRLAAGYTNLGRWADQQIDADRYLFTSDLIILGVGDLDPITGALDQSNPFNRGVVTNGGYMESFEGRSGGILSLNGEGASMEVPSGSFNPKIDYAFCTWIYLEEWTEGAYIFQKEIDDNHGFSIRLGKYANGTNVNDIRQVIIRVNGVEYISRGKLQVGAWHHIGVSSLGETKNNVFLFSVDGVAAQCPNLNQKETFFSYLVSGLRTIPAYIGKNLKGKLDETVIYHARKTAENFKALSVNPPAFPSETVRVEGLELQTTFNSYWRYERPDDVGYDFFSCRYFTELMREPYKGYRGYKVKAGIGGWSDWEQSIKDASFRKSVAASIRELLSDDLYEGVDVDLEWCYSDECFNNYGLLVEEIRKALPEGKSFSITPHYVSYRFPKDKMKHVDAFLFQIYGPGKDVFMWNIYKDAHNRFVGHGFDKSKIIMSYATTTSRAYNLDGSDMPNAPAPIGLGKGGINGASLLDGDYTPDMNTVVDTKGYLRYITGLNQVIDRTEWVQDNDLGGIFYWDLGNDVPSSHKYSFLKHSNYVLASNVDTLITEVSGPVSINSPFAVNKNVELKLSYNPETQRLILLNGETLAVQSFRIYSVVGDLRKEESGVVSIGIGELPAGSYYVVAEGSNGSYYRSAFVK